jgi:hypothetical protein
MRILYRPILNIQLWHDYALEAPDERETPAQLETPYNGQPEMPYTLPTDYVISDILVLKPTRACQQTLKNLRWVARPHAQGVTLFAEVDAVDPDDPDTDYRTKIPVNRLARLTFWLEVNDPTFANYTNLPLSPADRGQFYYFSNVSGSTQSYERTTESGDTEIVDYLFLSQPLAAYDANAEYFIGSLVIDADHTYESLTYQSIGTDASTLEDTDSWARLPRSEYVSDRDQLPRQNLSRLQNILAASPGSAVTFSLTDINGQRSFTQTTDVPESHPDGDPMMVGLNFAGQAPGRYQLIINNTLTEGAFVLFDPLAAPKAYALVELAIASDSVPEPFECVQFQGEDTIIQPKTYILRFKNRTTRWRYRTLNGHGFDRDAPPEGFEVIDEHTYVTAVPRGLQRQFRLPIPNNGERNLPFPSPSQIKTDDQRPVTQVFSDVYL